MYDNLMNKFRFGGIDNPDIYLDETVMRMCYTHRRLFAQLAGQLMAEGQKDKALKVVQKAEEVIPATTVPHCWFSGSTDLAEIWADLGQNQKAEEIALATANLSAQYLNWYLSLSTNRLLGSTRECMRNLLQMEDAVRVLLKIESKQADTFQEKFAFYIQQLNNRGVQL